MKRVIISEEELARFTKEQDVALRSKGLLQAQMQSWGFLKENYDALKKVNTKVFEFDGFVIKTQNNPERIKSTTADVSFNRKQTGDSFLRFENLPEEQKSLHYYKDYLILCNPYPIFPEHFTIPSVIQKPQSIKEHFKDFLFLSRDMQNLYVLFYNGPACGASAPNHLHFQAGSKNFMPVDSEYEDFIKSSARKVYINNNLQIYFGENYLRNVVVLESGSVVEIEKGFNLIYSLLQKLFNADTEPLMNLLLYYIGGQWRLVIFPRYAHRPSYFYNEGKDKIVNSPGAVDMGGVLILPREEDFDKITKDVIIDIFREVSISKEYTEYLFKKVNEAKAFMNA